MRCYKLITTLSLLLMIVFTNNAFAFADSLCLKKWFSPKPEIKKEEKIQVIADNSPPISLQNPYTRKIAHCYGNNVSSADDCARYFEKFGFVRFREIPYKTANFDFLHVDTFPTRRWRDSERTPRW